MKALAHCGFRNQKELNHKGHKEYRTQRTQRKIYEKTGFYRIIL